MTYMVNALTEPTVHYADLASASAVSSYFPGQEGTSEVYGQCHPSITVDM